MEDYWGLYPVSFKKYVEAYRLNREDEVKEKDYLNWLTGRYILIAFNSPKKYPDKPFFEKSEQRAMTSEEMEARVRNINTLLGGKFNDKKKDK